MTERMSAAQFKAKASKRPSKYRNVAMEVDGIRFASKREAAFYSELKIREKAGEVFEVELQRRFALTAPNGMLMTTYVADFHLYDAIARRNRVVDVKGYETDVFKLKRKMMRALLGIEVEIVK